MRKTIQLSEYLEVKREDLESKFVFDAVLGMDIKLFVDPKLLVYSDIPEFEGANDKIYQYFGRLLQWHKKSIKSARLRKVVREMLTIPEPKGVSIGYGNKSDRGTTSISESVANDILLSASEILAFGVDDGEILEVLGLFVKGYGADSISDLMIHITYSNFCEFTHRVCKELGIATKKFILNEVTYELPEHPFNDCHIIFVPHVFLRRLPIASDWGEVVDAAAENQELRRVVNKITVPVFKDIFENLKNSDIKVRELAQKKFADLLEVYQSIVAEPYNLALDNSGYYHLAPFVRDKFSNVSVNKPGSIPELIDFVRVIIHQYKRGIEDNGGNRLLYRKSETGALLKDEPHNEDVSQDLFYLVADVFCRLANVALSGESNAGRGPVDFALATGYSEKVLVEIKKSKHSKLISGYKKQVTTYKKSENAAHCFYVVIDVKKKKSKKEISELDELMAYVEKHPIDGIEVVVIDGLIYPSPSKL